MRNFKSGYKQKQSHYYSFQPAAINKAWEIDDMEIITLLSKADRMLGRLDMYSEHVPIDLFISMHILKEATQSTRIEGTQTNMEEALRNEEDVPLDKRDDWNEVQNYINAMNEAVKMLNTLPFSSRLIKNVHKVLMDGVRGTHKQPGEFRKSQNWIGGSNINNATFVPPIHTEIDGLMSDIEYFVHNEENAMPELIKIAIIHYQFETIHPFLDGNGRTGRLLITLYLVSMGILKRPILYLSDYLEHNRAVYYDLLMDVRLNNKINEWIKFFLKGVIVTAEKGVNTFSKILELRSSYNERIKSLGSRANNANKVIEVLYARPLIDAQKVQELTESAPNTAYKLLDSLVDLNILKEVTGGKRGRQYMLHEYFNLFID